MVRPERRTRGDLVVSVAIVAVVAVAALAAWNFSSAAKATSDTGPPGSYVATPLAELPATLRTSWTTRSDLPVTTLAGTVVTTRGGEVVGSSPGTGDQRWRYRRDTALCGLTTNAGMVLAFYPDARGCGEVTALDPATGQRRYTRSSQEDRDLNLASDGTHVVAQGARRVDVFRSDLVTTVQYGRPDVPVNPDTQPRPQCTIESALPASGSVAVLETCPNEPNPRLTVISAAPKDADRPQETSSVVAPSLGAAVLAGADRPRLLAASSTTAAVYVPAQGGQSARVVTVGARGEVVQNLDITTSAGGAPRAVPTSVDAGLVSFFTGTSTVVINTTTFAAEMVIPESRGPGAVLGGQIVVPGPTSLTAYDLDSRQLARSVPVERPGYTGGPILLTAVGDSLVSQWGTTVAAYRP